MKEATAVKSGARPQAKTPPLEVQDSNSTSSSTEPSETPPQKRKFTLSDLVPDGDREIVYPPFGELTMLIYGPQGAGKTSFFGRSGKALILSTEPGARFLPAKAREIKRFSKDPDGHDRGLDFCTMVAGIQEAFAEGKLRERGVEIIVIDTIDRLHQMAVADICAAFKVESIGDIPFGKGYALAVDAVKREVRRLQAISPVAFISHAITATEELENVSGVKKEVERLKPSVDRRVGEWLAGEQNLVGYAYKSVDGKFLVRFHSDARLETKDRTGLLEAGRKPIELNWETVNATYAAAAEARGITLRSRWE